MTTMYSFDELLTLNRALWELFPEFRFPAKFDICFDIKTLGDLEREYRDIPLSVAQEIQDILKEELDISIKELDNRIDRERYLIHVQECSTIMKFLASDLPDKVKNFHPDKQREIILDWLANVN